MASEIKFRDLPFEPVAGQVIYYEGKRDSKANKFIRNNHDWLVDLFRRNDMDFCYVPVRAQEAVSYNAPYAVGEGAFPSLLTYAVGSPVSGPCLVFALDIPVKDDSGNTVLQCVPIKTNWFKSTQKVFKDLVQEIKQISREQSRHYRALAEPKPSGNIRFSIVSDEPFDDGVRYSRKRDSVSSDVKFATGQTRMTKFAVAEREPYPGGSPAPMLNPDLADSQFATEAMKIVEEIKAKIGELRNRGINTMFLHELIDQGEKLSRLRVTADKRLFLVDYGNREIKMTALVKAVFLLFLKHPEGIRFKELSDYYDELLGIYQGLNPNGSKEKQENSIKDVTNPCLNSINEKCARIREAFVGSFDERLARNYFVTGERGEPKRITIDRTMVTWE